MTHPATDSRPSSTRPGPTRGTAIAALGLLLPVPSLGTAASMFWWPGSLLGQGLFLAGKLWLVVLPVAWLVAVEKERPGWSPPCRGGFRVAALLGLGMSLAIGVLYLVARHQAWLDPGLVADRARQTGLSSLGLYLAGASYWITLNSLMEEYVWRWFCFRQCEALVGGKAAVFGSALGFTLHHVVALSGQFAWPLTVVGSIGVFTGGAIWSWVYLRYRSIWPAYLSHAIVDIAIFIIGYHLIFC